jgi:DNA ligase (NAD+)
MKIEIPNACPVCNGEVELINQQLFCMNPTCSAKTLKNLLHFVKTMKVMGLGEKTLEKLKIETISDLYEMSQDQMVALLGQKIGTKIYDELDKSKSTTLARFIAALGIPLIGKTAGDKLQSTITALNDINAENCKKAGLGAKATDNLINWYQEEGQFIDFPFEFEESEPVESGLAVCISGKVPGYTKAKIKELLLDYNVTVKDNVTKDLDYLITEEVGTTKVKKAEQYNINIISFELFMEKLKNE